MQRTVSVYTCDRCTYIDQFDHDDECEGWGLVSIEMYKLELIIGGNDKSKGVDLCHQCMIELRAWLKG